MKATTINERHVSKSGFGARVLFYILLLSIIGLSKVFALKRDDLVQNRLVFVDVAGAKTLKTVNSLNHIVR